jgi:hypothetical protein
MRSSLHLVLGLTAAPALLSITACGPAPAPVTPPAPTAAPAPPPAPVATTTYELSPVPEPADVVGVARWKSPAASLGAIASCAGVPQAVFDAGAKAIVERALHDMLRGSVDAKALAAVVAMDAPVDAVMTLDPAQKKPVMGAFSIGLTSLERAREAAEAAAGHPLTEMMPGAWKVGSVRELHCVIAAAAGPTPARLVCGGREKDLTTLAPYLTRTMPTVAAGTTDVHGELRFSPVEARYGSLLRQTLSQLPLVAQSEMAIGDAKFDRTILDAATGIEEELGALTGDLDKLTLDFGAGTPTCLKASGSLVLRGKKSWLANGMAERLDRAGAPPAIYWRLPKEAETATYTRAADPTHWQPVLRTARSLIEGALAKKNIGSAADRKALVDLLAFPLGKDTSTVHANGHAEPANAPAAKGAKAGGPNEMEAVIGSWIGWNVYGFDEGPTNIAKQLKDFVAVYNRAGLLAPLKKEMKADAKYLPSVKTVAPPAKLGKDALDVEIKISGLPLPTFDVNVDAGNVSVKGKTGAKPAGGKDKLVNITAHVLLMADGSSTWLAFGLDRDDLVQRLLAAKTGAPQEATLGARTGLDDLKNGKTMSGGFLTLGYFTRAATSSIGKILSGMPAGQKAADAQQALALLGTLPHKGEMPILITTTGAEAGPGPTSELTLAVPRDAVEDVSSLAINVLQLASAGKP